MILIALVFSLIIGLEWKYLTHNRRSLRSFRIVMGMALLLFLSCETLFIIHNQWSIGMFINSVFEPFQRLLTFEP
jgi:hypothetical protein